jgi:hypothetical protein
MPFHCPTSRGFCGKAALTVPKTEGCGKSQIPRNTVFRVLDVPALTSLRQSSDLRIIRGKRALDKARSALDAPPQLIHIHSLRPASGDRVNSYSFGLARTLWAWLPLRNEDQSAETSDDRGMSLLRAVCRCNEASSLPLYEFTQRILPRSRYWSSYRAIV